MSSAYRRNVHAQKSLRQGMCKVAAAATVNDNLTVNTTNRNSLTRSTSLTCRALHRSLACSLISLVVLLSCIVQNVNPWFLHPADDTAKVFVFADVPHLLKLIRNHYLDSGLVIEEKLITPQTIAQVNKYTSVSDVSILYKINDEHLSVRGAASGRAPPEPYYGRYIGQFTNFAHGIKGTIYAVDESTLFIKSFAYDGTGPDAFFWVGKTPRPSPEGYIIPYPEEYAGIDPPILQAHNNTDIILRLPMGKRIKDIKWLSVWCRRFTVDFGEVFIPPNLDVPKPRVLPEFKRLAHGLRSSNISVLDAKTFYIPNLHYDGAGPDAYFWVGNGSEPNIMGVKVPNEVGSLEPLRGYQGEDIEIQLPGSLTVYDIDWLSVWCVEYRHNFGHVFIPKDLDVPPALGQTKITTTTTPRPVYANCREIIPNKLQVKWELQGEYIQIELFGRITEDQYMAFGLSGANGRAQMSQSDVVVAFYDTTARVFRAEDYYISDLSQCDGKHGTCPDERIGGRNDVVVLSGDRKNGVTSVRYRRLIQTNEPIYDFAIPTDREVSVIAAIGPLNSLKEANAHSHTGTDHTIEDVRINFSSRNDHSCKNSLYSIKDESGPTPWPTRKINNATVFTARIGPTGGKRGYTAITGIPSWGIAWYLNDLLIPEITVQRGKTYEFYVEGGDNPAQPARYHPFYITDSPEGGLGQKTGRELSKQKTYAGVEFDMDGNPSPTAVGRYCEWVHRTIDRSAEIETFEEYMKTVMLECDEGEPGYLNWTVPLDAPDLLYYQCFTHQNLGWKINVIDAKDSSAALQITITATIVYTISTLFSLFVTQNIFSLSIIA